MNLIKLDNNKASQYGCYITTGSKEKFEELKNIKSFNFKQPRFLKGKVVSKKELTAKIDLWGNVSKSGKILKASEMKMKICCIKNSWYDLKFIKLIQHKEVIIYESANPSILEISSTDKTQFAIIAGFIPGF